MISVQTYRQLPRLLGAQTFVVLCLLQAAKLEGLGPVSAQWLQDNAPGFGKNTITDALRKLTSPEYQLAVRSTGGWVFNAAGAFQLPLGYALVDEQPDSAKMQNPSEREIPSYRDFGDSQIIDAEPAEPEKTQKTAKNAPQIPSEREIPSQREFDQSLVKLSINYLKDSEENLNLLDSQNSREAENRVLLKNSGMLFEKAVFWNKSFASKTQNEILSRLAQAYDNRKTLDHPWGVVYKNLQKGTQPADLQYREDPAKYLPREYLVKCGFEFAAPLDQVDQVDEQAEDQALEDAEYLPTLDIRENGGMSPNKAWAMALHEFEQDLPGANFERVINTRPGSWNEDTGELVIQADAGDCDWLESRLQVTVERMLTGMMNCPVSVKFEQRAAEGAGND